MTEREQLWNFQKKLLATFLVTAMISNLITATGLLWHIFTAQTALVAIPIACLIFTVLFLQRVPGAAVLASTIGLLSALLQPAYMILGK